MPYPSGDTYPSSSTYPDAGAGVYTPPPPIDEPATPGVSFAPIPDADFAASHRVAIQAEVLHGKTGEVLGTIYPLDGSVSYDSRAAARASFSLTLVDDGTLGLIPVNAQSLLAPYGNEVRVARGIAYSDRTELVPMGVFPIESCSATDSPDGIQITLSGQDRSSKVAEHSFEVPYQIDHGTPLTQVIRDLVTRTLPLTTFQFPSTPHATPTVVVIAEGGNPWDECLGMATAMGMQLYFDSVGVLRLEAIGSPTVTEMAEGAGGILLSASREWDRAPVFNKAIVTAEPQGQTPLRGEAYDNDPLSPTYWDGPFGRKPRFWASNQWLEVQAHVDNCAAGLLEYSRGAPDTVSFSGIPNVNLRPNSTIRITRERLGLAETHILDQVTIPLGPEGEMSGQTRAVALEFSL